MTMKKTILILGAAGIGLASAPALADHHASGDQQAEEPEQASIPFADSHGIRTWRPAETSEAILIEGANGQWYRAEFGRHCMGLNYSEAVGFETRGTGRFDRYSVVRTRDDRCHVRSLYEIPDPDADEEAE
jgi:hypothetical protein